MTLTTTTCQTIYDESKIRMRKCTLAGNVDIYWLRSKDVKVRDTETYGVGYVNGEWGAGHIGSSFYIYPCVICFTI